MKITPLEIRQRTFEKNFRGYDKDEVNAFLLTLSQEWERLLDETRELKLKLEASEKEVARMREVENSLFKTLKTAEDTGTSLIEQSRQQAELLIREAQLKAETTLNEARAQAKKITDAAELRSRQLLAEMDVRLRALADNYKKLQDVRENLLSELRRIAEDTLDRSERLRASQPQFDADAHINKISLAEHQELTNTLVAEQPSDEQPKAPELPEVKPKAHKAEAEKPQPVLTSFFDEIG
ncbi:MAG: DivIVA domain-containing protein [Cyclobacteriaceae bacterium]|nr:DivIVA domain-containing protein [Cyclobacteriaceae bacterium]